MRGVKDSRRWAKRADAGTAAAAACSGGVTPNCLQTLYNIPQTKANASGNGLGVTGFINEIPSKDDLRVRTVWYRRLCGV